LEGGYAVCLFVFFLEAMHAVGMKHTARLRSAIIFAFLVVVSMAILHSVAWVPMLWFPMLL
jgi:hypothetical protein